MFAALLLLLLVLFGVGFTLHWLWIIAALFLVPWLIGFAVGTGARTGERRRWYRW